MNPSVPQPTDTYTALPGWELPVHDAPDALFTAVRTACAAGNFTELHLCARFSLGAMSDFKSTRDGRTNSTRHHDALETLTDLFLDLVGVREGAARATLGDIAVDALLQLNLLYRDADTDDTLLSRMLMYPTAGVLLISDRTFARPGEQLEMPTDIVYTAITRNTSTFVRMLLPAPCDAFLEMCAGNGVAALAMAGRAQHAWSLDITERATRVATFNARLNGLDNVTVAIGDLYEPVTGLTFDRIAAHPPYVPSKTQALVYRDGGTDGEFITRRLVNELPTYLRPGGRFVCTCIATDRTDAPLQHRIREWLGDAHESFDVIVAATGAEHPSEHYFRKAIQGSVPFQEAIERHDVFKALRIEAMVYSTFVIERHIERAGAPRPPVTVRLQRSPTTTGRELEQFCDWLSRREYTDFRDRLLGAFPCIDAHAALHTTQHHANGKWKEDTQEFRTTWPFISTIECPDDVAAFLSRCDGTRTVRQLIAWLRQKKMLPIGVPDDAVLKMVTQCAAAGALHLDDRSSAPN